MFPYPDLDKLILQFNVFARRFIIVLQTSNLYMPFVRSFVQMRYLVVMKSSEKMRSKLSLFI